MRRSREVRAGVEVARRVVQTLLVLAVAGISGRPAASQGSAADGRPPANTWSARSSTGLTLTGTWTAGADPATGHVTGTWTLLDGRGQTIRRGGWSAAKSAAAWTGTWRATISGSTAAYTGTWSASVDRDPHARLAALFEAALQAVVGGRWQTARHSGTWSIRAFS